MRTIILEKDGEGYFTAYFEDDRDVRVVSCDTKAEAIGKLILRFGGVPNLQIKSLE